MPRFRVVPYRAGSRGATTLSRALGGLCLKVDGTSRFRPRHDDTIINWGNVDPPIRCTYNGQNLRDVSNKRTFFQNQAEAGLQDILPDFWADRNLIPADVFNGNGRVVCRTVLAGHSGEGIVIASSPEELVNAPLYTRYIKKQDEYRIHVGVRRNGMAARLYTISQQRKGRNRDVENPDWQVRNHANGFVYVRGDCNPPAQVIEAAHRSLTASGLDFGAVDVIYNANSGRAYVLEINTAPGLEGQTVDDYVAFFRGN